MKTILFKSAFLSFLATATSASSLIAETDTDKQQIVGGEQADVGDYPYFVEMGGCGGALIASDTVLFAAHCEDWRGKQVSIGAYKARSKQDGAQERYCEEYAADPKFNYTDIAPNYDFALCKLDSPVTIDESKVRLVLNEHDSVPGADEELIVMGVGALKEGRQWPEFLHHVKVPTVSNQECNEEKLYNGEITDLMICAGFPDKGEKDSCQGDSGGPLVQRIKQNDGTFVDMHVGVVSWGIGCGRKDKPGVYARTSKRFFWIKDTMCNEFKSTAYFCHNEPSPPEPPSPCEQELTITVNTDDFGIETGWTLEDSEHTPLQTRKYLFNNHKNEHKLCLKSNECYKWTITDIYGDGLCNEDGKCGNYFADLNGKRIVDGDGRFERSKEERFCTHDDDPCEDNKNLQFKLEIKTDSYGDETSWELMKKEDNGELTKILFGDNYESDTRYNLPSDVGHYCLEEDACYIFTIFDSYGDGMTAGNGNMEGFVNGKKVVGGKGVFTEKVEEFCVTNGDCNPDSSEFTHMNKSHKTCSDWVADGSPYVVRRRCNRRWERRRIYDWCPQTCTNAGVGTCYP